MELPRYRSKALPQEATLSPQAAAAGAGAMGQALSGIAMDFAKVTAQIVSVEAQAKAQAERSRQDIALREFVESPEWSKTFQERNGERVATADVIQSEFDAFQKSLKASTPKLGTRAAQQWFDRTQNESLENYRLQVQGMSNKLRVSSARAATAEEITNYQRSGNFEGAANAIAESEAIGLFDPGEASQLRMNNATQALQREYNDLADFPELDDAAGLRFDDPARISIEDEAVASFRETAVRARQDPGLSTAEGRTLENWFNRKADDILRTRQLEQADWQREQERFARLADERERGVTASLGARVDTMVTRFVLGLGAPADYIKLYEDINKLPDTNEKKHVLLEKMHVVDILSGVTPPPDGVLDPPFTMMNEREQNEQIIRWEGRARNATTEQTLWDGLLAMAYQARRDTARRMTEDPAGFEQQRGNIPAPKLQEPTGDDEEEVREVRIANWAAIAESGRQLTQRHGVRRSGFTAGQMEGIARIFENSNPAGKAIMVNEFVQAGGEQFALSALKEIGAKGASVMALAGVLSLERKRAAELVWEGEALLKNDPSLHQSRIIDSDLASSLGTAYGVGSPARNDIEQAIKAAMVAMVVREGGNPATTTEISSRILNRAVQEVTGGLVEYRGWKMPAPIRGVTQRQFDDWTNSLTVEDFAGIWNETPDETFQQFRAGRFRLDPAGEPGAYRLMQISGFSQQALIDKEGREFLIHYRDSPIRRPVLDYVERMEGFGT